MSAVDQMNAHAWDMRNHDFRRARELAKKALAQARAQTYERGVAQAQLTLGFCYFRDADYPNALMCSDAALEQFEAVHDAVGIQRSLTTLGMVYGEMGDLSNALKIFLRNYRLCQTSNDREAEAKALNNLAIIYVNFGDYSRALDYYFKGLSIVREIGATGDELKTLQNLGVVYFEMGRHQDALEYLNEGLSLLETIDDKHTEGLILMNIGRIYHDLGDGEQALTHLKHSLSMMQDQGDKSTIGYILAQLGVTYLGLNDKRQAETHLKRSLDINQTLGNLRGETQTCIHLGALYTQQARHDEAVSVLEHALAQASEIDARAEIYRSHRALAKSLAAKEDFEQAYEHLGAYIKTKEAVFNDASDQRLQALRVSHEVEQAEREKEIYRLRSVELAQANERLQSATEQLERQTKEDPLTGLYNRRHFDTVLDDNYRRAKGSGLPMSVMICDIDNFKKVNDSFSHAVGDEVLIQVARLFEAGIRAEDTVARYGGEEFVIHFPETSADIAYKICERLRQSIAEHPWSEIHPELSVTVSMGLCDAVTLGSGETMIARADDTLYDVKHNGKNHVRIWEEAELELHRG